MPDTFKALLLHDDGGTTRHEITDLRDADLPPGDVLLKVRYSSLNYKDGLAVTGKGKIVRAWPMVPGIDLAGEVLESEASGFAPGDEVILTGWGVGEKYWGGYSQRQRVRADWLVPLPEGMDCYRAMAVGTAGLTAMLCVMTLEEAGVGPGDGEIVVTGASGGVGSVATALLAGLGYAVTAVSGKPDIDDFLRGLGARNILRREAMSEPARPLEKQRWAGGVDTVGGTTLARILAETGYNGCVAACGLAGGADLPTTVMPFILRNVSLRGVDSVQCPLPRRQAAWKRIAKELPESALGEIGRTATLEQVPQLADDIVAGRIRGRVVVDLDTAD